MAGVPALATATAQSPSEAKRGSDGVMQCGASTSPPDSTGWKPEAVPSGSETVVTDEAVQTADISPHDGSRPSLVELLSAPASSSSAAPSRRSRPRTLAPGPSPCAAVGAAVRPSTEELLAARSRRGHSRSRSPHLLTGATARASSSTAMPAGSPMAVDSIVVESAGGSASSSAPPPSGPVVAPQDTDVAMSAADAEFPLSSSSSSSSSPLRSPPRGSPKRSPPRGVAPALRSLLEPALTGLATDSETGSTAAGTGTGSSSSSTSLAASALGSLEGSPVPSRTSRRKRSPDDTALLDELPPREAEAVSLALEQWGRLRHRVKALEPTLRREGALVQEILDTGLRDENRRTLRKLTQSSKSGDVEETIQQVGKAIGANRERLERILERNHGELVRLSTTAVSDLKEDVLREVDEVLARLKRALAAVRCELLGAKERSDMTAVRRTGRSFNNLKALVRRLDDERRLITRNSALAALLVTVCRRVLPVRQVDPAALRDIPPSCEGYRRIMDFYFFTDAGLYFFGDYPSGPNWFVRLKRNVAILLVQDESGRTVYNHFAVSGEHRAPGASPASSSGPLKSTEAEDEHGRVFNRQHDAEFKLLSGFCASKTDGALRGTGTLWSRKPLCRSCLGAVQQVCGLYPNLKLNVTVGSISPSGAGHWSTAANGSVRCVCRPTSIQAPRSSNEAEAKAQDAVCDVNGHRRTSPPCFQAAAEGGQPMEDPHAVSAPVADSVTPETAASETAKEAAPDVEM
eukprot:TRINITY_DN62577_c1_g2_i1.p1 TRINITY_DN62577_c1_g2~~TRINITY_DN62577_c1_g2_i1.p1  ORF type:complete len:748 (-),score=124.36 TRINITY_DN62577_c1_g2_i1:104-2347(-)